MIPSILLRNVQEAEGIFFVKGKGDMKYMGSKRRIAKYILPIILKDRKQNQYYVEPFVGGCNSIECVGGLRIGGDNNKYLISFLRQLQEGWTPPEM